MSSQSTTTPPRDTIAPASVVGVDLGVKQLLVAAPADAGAEVSNALAVGGGVERDLYDSLGDTLNRLDELPADTGEVTATTVEEYRSLLRQRFALAAYSAVEYADRHDADVIALENIEYEDGTLLECAQGATKAGEWVLPAFRDRLEATLRAEGHRVERVDAAYTTQRCHICGQVGDVSRATISCTNAGCVVDAVCRDRSAAVSIANRVTNENKSEQASSE